MIRLQDIQEGLIHLVAWEQSYNPATAIDEKLTETESGLTFQGAHPLVTLENIRNIMPDDWDYQYPAWNNTTHYKKDAKVKHSSKLWIAVHPNTGSEPGVNDNPDWAEYNMISDFLIHLTKNLMLRICIFFLDGLYRKVPISINLLKLILKKLSFVSITIPVHSKVIKHLFSFLKKIWDLQ